MFISLVVLTHTSEGTELKHVEDLGVKGRPCGSVRFLAPENRFSREGRFLPDSFFCRFGNNISFVSQFMNMN